VSGTYREIGDGIRGELLHEVGRNRFRLWFRDTAVSAVNGDTVTLAVPTEVHRTWLEFTYGDLLHRACARVLGEGVKVRVEVSSRQDERRGVRERLPTRPDEWEALLEKRRPPPTLESFVAHGPDRFPVLLLSQLVHGSGAPDLPSIYLFGDVGCGKTHLLQGLHAAVEKQAPGECLYLTTRRFTSLYVSALRARDLEAVRAFEVDLSARRLVLLDGLDALAGRAATQGELVRLQDRCLGTGTRFVFTGRRHPRELEGLSATLRSRLQGGVVVRIPTPGRDALGELLAARAERIGPALPEAIREAILDRTTSVRGAVEMADRWAAASLEMGSDLEREWLSEIAPSVTTTAREEVVRRAKDLVAKHFGIAPVLLDRPTKVRRAAFPRRVAMYLVYRAAALPLSQLGRTFGLRSHSSVSRAIHEIRAEREKSAEVEQEIDGLLARL
jgi:chromosomal replication initiator protein